MAAAEDTIQKSPSGLREEISGGNAKASAFEEAASILQKMAGAAFGAGHGANGRAHLPPRLTPHRAAEAAGEPGGIWKAETRYRALIEQIPVITFIAAMDETVHELYISPQIEAMLGFTQAEWLDNPFLWYNQLHPDDRERWQQEFGRTCATGVQFKSEYRLMARDGRTVWIHGECQLIRDDQGQPLFLQGVAYDITEMKRSEEALQRMHRDLEKMVEQRTRELGLANDALRSEIQERRQADISLAQKAAELARSNAELSQFAYVASHDLQEPLRMMASFAELLRERYHGKLDADADEFIQYITDGAGRMQRLIHDLLAYSRVGKGDAKPSRVACTEIVGAVCENLRAAIRETQARVTQDPLPLVLGSESQILQLFQNLMGNAIKFTARGRVPEIHVGARREQDEWLFSVRDNGIGIEPKYQKKIFQIFQRLQSRLEYPGTGIGLAICRKIVERHGGRIWVESQANQGSTFFFTLPVTEAQDGRHGG